jgi:hypothetical protein
MTRGHKKYYGMILAAGAITYPCRFIRGHEMTYHHVVPG